MSSNAQRSYLESPQCWVGRLQQRICGVEHATGFEVRIVHNNTWTCNAWHAFSAVAFVLLVVIVVVVVVVASVVLSIVVAAVVRDVVVVLSPPLSNKQTNKQANKQTNQPTNQQTFGRLAEH